MRNVIVFATRWGRFAVELRWVREVVILGHVTPVPGAPAHIAGAINVRGTITPVMDVGKLQAADDSHRKSSDPPPGPYTSAPGGRGSRTGVNGDGAVLLDVEDLAVALRIIKVDEVATVGDGPPLPSSTCAGAATASVMDSRREQVPLIDPPELVRISLAAAHSLAASDPLTGFRSPAAEHSGVSGRISTQVQYAAESIDDDDPTDDLTSASDDLFG